MQSSLHKASLDSLTSHYIASQSGVVRVADVQHRVQEPQMRALRMRFAAIKQHRNALQKTIKSLTKSIDQHNSKQQLSIDSFSLNSATTDNMNTGNADVMPLKAITLDRSYD